MYQVSFEEACVYKLEVTRKFTDTDMIVDPGDEESTDEDEEEGRRRRTHIS